MCCVVFECSWDVAVTDLGSELFPAIVNSEVGAELESQETVEGESENINLFSNQARVTSETVAPVKRNASAALIELSSDTGTTNPAGGGGGGAIVGGPGGGRMNRMLSKEPSLLSSLQKSGNDAATVAALPPPTKRANRA